MEGLLFESSATTPYHFLNQAELSAGPSEPEVGLPYGALNVTLGVQHLQLLGVKYFMAETPQVEQEAAVDPCLQLVAKSGPWTYNYSGADTTTTWQIYLVKDSPLVTPLANDPVVLSGVKPGPASWLGTASHEGPALSWYADPSKWNVELAQSGPSDWPRTPVSDVRPTVKHVGTTKVTSVTQTDSSISFHVSRVGTPVLVKVSYFPNWHASGADGPCRVTPNLMVVVPTSHDVTLSYGASSANYLGLLATLIGLVALVVMFVVPSWRRWRIRRTACASSGQPGNRPTIRLTSSAVTGASSQDEPLRRGTVDPVTAVPERQNRWSQASSSVTTALHQRPRGRTGMWPMDGSPSSRSASRSSDPGRRMRQKGQKVSNMFGNDACTPGARCQGAPGPARPFL